VLVDIRELKAPPALTGSLRQEPVLFSIPILGESLKADAPAWDAASKGYTGWTHVGYWRDGVLLNHLGKGIYWSGDVEGWYV
jgi:hypothetical protein